ncbi:LLM class F420-dependent oxidoreductase [Mycobacterium intracellulare]|nr:LLM class F420-dependent oxidoreductase [Mycobacterium intracellulare]BCO70782.1 LLM class F420-dependent oxidoreductase [Mycobacterium intracellulare]BCO76334.1 LLM class F420-dependent oxidoreductase [Mycobacterium intracellulare]BCP18327.1 LLM class F420-dependent oxidoreductase [Mycobacterium intracellulare]BCP23764.1 LLM class F420-dependent oxidoreductase [Mycobacterium intracellulare]
MGFGSLWIAEGAASREALTHAAVLLAATSRIVIGTGIASIWARDATAMAAGTRTLADAFPGRFILGMGVSHSGAVGRRGHKYAQRPLTKMREYLDAMDGAPLLSPVPDPPPTRVLAALRPRMLELAATRTNGVHSYFVPVEHTRLARAVIGADALLIPEQAVVLETDPPTARSIARTHTSHYLGRENYRANLQSLGIPEAALAGDGTDEVVDALVAWGDGAGVATRVAEHLGAGADHVVLQPITQAATDADDTIAQFVQLGEAVKDLLC